MPYCWSLVLAHAAVPWNLAAVVLLSPLKAEEPGASRDGYSVHDDPLMTPRRTDDSTELGV